MTYISKYGFNRLNKDDAEKILENGDFRELVNGRIGLTGEESAGAVENIRGTEEVVLDVIHPSSGILTIIGSYYSQERKSTYLFVYDTNGHHAIYQYGYSSGGSDRRIVRLLQWDGLNFRYGNITDTYEDNRTPYGLISNIDVVGDDLYWVDDSNGPRVLNITKALNNEYDTNTSEEMISALRRPPHYPLSVAKKIDATYSFNYIENHTFKFAYRYVYNNNKKSVISTYSKIIPYNEDSDTYNYIQVDIPGNESIPSLVESIELLVKIDNGAFHKIATMNTSTTTYDFYNDVLGVTIPNTEEAILYHDIPINAYAQTFVKNRLWYGNCLIGYDSPENKMTVSTVEIDTTQPRIVDAYKRDAVDGITGVRTLFDYYVYDQQILKYLKCDYDEGTNTVSNLEESPQYNATDLEVNWPSGNGYYDLVLLDSNLDIGSVQVYNGNFFIPKSKYGVGYVFMDFGTRNSGVIKGGSISIPDSGSGKHQITWDLTALTANYIPEWATHVQVVLTKNLSWSFFINNWTSDIFYRRNDAYNKLNYGARDLMIDISSLLKVGIGYTFNEGDRILLKDISGVDYDFEIDSQDGNFLFVDGVDIGGLTNQMQKEFFIYTPIKSTDDVLYYEIGEAIPINNPGESTRAISSTTGVIEGDSRFFERDQYTYAVSGYSTTDPAANQLTQNTTGQDVYAMSSNDKYYEKWHTNHGRPNVINDIGQQRYPTLIKYSGEILPGSSQNKLHEFTSLNRYDKIQENRTPIVSLRALSEDLVLCNHVSTTSSLYAGVGFVKTKDGTEFLAKTDGVITDDRRYSKDFGAIPSTIKVHGKRAWWIDFVNRSIVRYTEAGPESISEKLPTVDYKVDRFFKEALHRDKLYNSVDTILGYDPENEEVFVTLYNKETYIFSEKSNTWTGRIELMDTSGYAPRGYGYHNDQMLIFARNAKIWRHLESDVYNNFLGTQRNRKLKFVAGEAADIIKVFNNIWVNGSLPDSVVITNHKGQQVTLTSDDFTDYETIMKAPIWFDENSSGGRLNGERIRSGYISIEINTSSTEIDPLYMVSILWDNSPYTR